MPQKNRKKSLVGYAEKDIFDRLRFQFGGTRAIYLVKDKRDYTPVKVKITIEEL